MKCIFQELEVQKATPRNLFSGLFGQVALMVLMTLVISGSYWSVAEPHKVHVTTQQGHALKRDGAAGTAAIAMGGRE